MLIKRAKENQVEMGIIDTVTDRLHHQMSQGKFSPGFRTKGKRVARSTIEEEEIILEEALEMALFLSDRYGRNCWMNSKDNW